jgi:tRNA dimethylallyltransferase
VSKRTVYIICGPTATGKTALAIQLAQRLGTSVISADSRQCYKELNIGTAKPDEKELKQVRHYFIDEFAPTTEITAAAFEKLALSYLDTIFRTQDNAIVCGGTGLYIKALCEGLDEMPEVDAKVNEEVNKMYEEKGMEWLSACLKEEDPRFAQSGEMLNPARMLRALVFMRSNNESILLYHTGEKKQRNFGIIKIGLDLPRAALYDRINQRVDKMMEMGLLEEVKRLQPLQQHKNLHTVGYTELFDYLNGKCTLEEAVNKIKQNTRNYAKRQLTWFRKDADIIWFAADEDKLAEKILAIK